MNNSGVVIRKYQASDRAQVRQICCDTAFMGKPSSLFFDGDDLFADCLTRYFTDYEPESCFVAEKEGKVVGYLIAAKDVSRMGKVFAHKIALKLLARAVFTGVFFRKKNIIFLGNCLRSMLRGEFRQPDVSGEYPATLHINAAEGSRGQGIGSQLIRECLVYLKGEAVKAVHLATMSEEAARFFESSGFTLLFSRQRSYFRHLLDRDFSVYVYGKKLG